MGGGGMVTPMIVPLGSGRVPRVYEMHDKQVETCFSNSMLKAVNID